MKFIKHLFRNKIRFYEMSRSIKSYSLHLSQLSLYSLGVTAVYFLKTLLKLVSFSKPTDEGMLFNGKLASFSNSVAFSIRF